MTGSLRIIIKDGFTERFLNLLARNGIRVWNIERKKNDELYCCISIKSFKKIRPFVKKCRVHVKIHERLGAPFFAVKYKSRYGLAAGIIIFAAFLFTMSSFVWEIEVIGDVPEAQAVKEDLAEFGIKNGSLSFSLDQKYAEQGILMKYGTLKWVKIELRGSKVLVYLKPAVVPPEIIPINEPCNIVAAKDGQIVKIEAFEGESVILKGDTVKKGELIVSGIIETTDLRQMLVHARARVTANTFTVLESKIPLIQDEYIPTGKKYKRNSLIFGNFSVQLYISGKIKYKSFEKEERSSNFSLGRNIILPIKIKTENFAQTRLDIRAFSEKEAKNLALNEIKFKETAALSGLNVKSREITYSSDGVYLYAKAVYIIEEDIAKQESIKIEGQEKK